MTRVQAIAHRSHANGGAMLPIPGLSSTTPALDGPCPYCQAEGKVDRETRRG